MPILAGIFPVQRLCLAYIRNRRRNPVGENLLSLCNNHCLRVLNSYYKKEREKLITFRSGDAETQIDLLLLQHGPEAKSLNCDAIPGEDFRTQHRTVRAKLEIRSYMG